MIKVLVADDHPAFRRGMISAFEQCPDMKVVGQAGNSDEVINLAGELQPDVVTMDISMPGSGGVTATANIQRTLPQVKVLIVTVSDKDQDLFAAIKAGAAGYVLKDVCLSELINAVRVVAKGEAVVSPAMAFRLLEEFRKVNGNKGFEKLGKLSQRESEVLQLVAKGSSNKQIANSLSISETTVKAHLRSILDKLQAGNRTQAAALAAARGWLNRS